MRPPKLFDFLLDKLSNAKADVSDRPVLDEALNRLRQTKTEWRDFSMFWPPRLVNALTDARLVPFVGAGLSIGAGAPSWAELLREHLKLTKNYVDDEDLKQDPLTLAEIASQRLGTSAVQATLRELTGRVRSPTTSHLALVALHSQVYITTNYDSLIEEAWKLVSGGGRMRVIVNDSDLVALGVGWESYNNLDEPLLFKIHGSIDRNDEQLILTRHDYRHHYRANTQFFDAIREILQKRHVLFAGFSHRDPEVTRLVDDAIYEFEHQREVSGTGRLPDDRPHFYSLQLDMLEHTPEIFAARGLVALRPPFVASTFALGRSISLSVALGELANVQQSGLHLQNAIDGELVQLANDSGDQLQSALGRLQAHSGTALAAISSGTVGVCSQALLGIGPIANQGVYLVDQSGTVMDLAVPAGLDAKARLARLPSFSSRPYFRIAKSFRQAFVSDSFKSAFNGNSTVALCVPLLEGVRFRGLLFAATQIGAWDWPVEQARPHWAKKRLVLLVDSNGRALFPPNQEIVVKDGILSVAGETPAANRGYHYDELFSLSRRDALIKHIVENIVPLSQDDDVCEFGSDFECYSVVTEIPRTRWKLAIVQPFVKTS